MKACGAVFLCLLLMLGGCRSQPDGANPDRTVQRLIQEARAALPGNWTITYEARDKALKIERHESAAAAASKPWAGFRVLPYLTPAAWQAKYAALQKRMSTIEKELSPDRPAHTEAERPQVEAYNQALEEQDALPDYHYRDIGLTCYWFDGNNEPFEGVVNETERAECLQVYHRFLGLLRKYEPSPAGPPDGAVP